MTLLRQPGHSQSPSKNIPPASSLSLQIASMVAQCSAAAQMPAVAPLLDQPVLHSPNRFHRPTFVSLRDLQLVKDPVSFGRSVAHPPSISGKRSRVESNNSTSSYRSQNKRQKLAHLQPHSRPSTSSPVAELRTTVPQSYTLDQTRSIEFRKALDRPLGVSVAALLQRKGSIHGGDLPLNRTGSATLVLEWPGYSSATTHIRFEHPTSSYITYSGNARRKMLFKDFAVTLAEKIRSWLCSLTRQPYKGKEKDWELPMECVPPIDELVLVAICPVHPDLFDGMWGIVLERIKEA